MAKSKQNQELNDKLFFQLLTDNGISIPEQEYKFHETRKFRFDYAWLEKKIALEIEGGVWLGNKSRHFSGVGILKDMEKYNLAAIKGWRLIRIDPSRQLSKYLIDTLQQVLL